MDTIALMLPNWIGDVIMATPTIRAVREQFPAARLIGVMRPYVADCLSGTHWLDESLFYSPKGKDAINRWQLARELQRRNVDAMLLLPNSLASGLVAWFGGARRRVGYARYRRRLLLTDPLEPPRDGKAIRPYSAVDYYLKLAEQIGCTNLSQQLKLEVAPEEAKAGETVWRKLGFQDKDRVVAISTGGAYGSAKHWPTHHSVSLARLLVEKLDAKVLVICGPAERESAAAVVREVGLSSVVSLADENLTIGLSKACIARSEMLITTDSGPRHIAAGLGKPTISLFGSTDPRWADNYNPRDIKLSMPLECSPCAKRVCPLGHHRCMEDLTPQRVLAAAWSVLHDVPSMTDAA